MWKYDPPLRDIRFVIEEVLDAPRAWGRIPAYADVDVDTARQIVEEAGRFASEILAPTNQSGDLEGCTWDDGRVRTPTGFREAYAAFVEAGWPALACEPDTGGQGLPQLMNAVLYEMMVSANHAWTMYPALLQGAYDCLTAHASDDLKDAYLAKIVSGEWLSTMCLTEAHAGSDLGLLRTRADPMIDGSYTLHGTKIFISGGEHDLTENIVHLVLARLAGAPSGTKGLSLFLVPKGFATSTPGEFLPNAVRCDGIEKKMGIKGSSTCVISFDGARGWMIGEPNRGLAAMFVMMNASRLHVGLQGLGHAEAAYQNALRYACERVQMRVANRPEDSELASAKAAHPIVWHPSVRRTLWTMRARLEGTRMLAYETAHLLDVALKAEDAAERALATDLVTLLTPVVKSYLTDNGFESASAALQLYGGHGYVHDYGIEQSVRDSRIAMIYEGTNEIQAIDLLVRKVLSDGGLRFDALLDWLHAGLQRFDDGEYVGNARALIGAVRAVTRKLVNDAVGEPEQGLRVADDFLDLTALLLLAQGWARADALAARALSDPATASPFYVAKRQTAHHYFSFVLPEATLLISRIDIAASEALPFLATT